MELERQVWTVEETAEILGLNRLTVYRGIERGEIPCLRIGDRKLISKARLNEMLRGKSSAE